MTVKVIAALLLASASGLLHAQSAIPAAGTSPAKKELVQKLLVLQQPAIDNIARGLVERPIVQMTQEVRLALQQVPADKREAVAKSIDADIKTYIGEATPLVSERAIKLAPSTIGTLLEDKFSEDELKQLVAWFESPVNKKFTQLGAEMQGNFTQRVLTESAPVVDPKLQTLFKKVRSDLGVPQPSEGTGAPAKAAASGAKAASK